jgi:hypothetical protein
VLQAGVLVRCDRSIPLNVGARYNKRDHDYTVVQIAFFRSVTVIIGVLWSAIVSRYWWPFTARRELRMGISEYVEASVPLETCRSSTVQVQNCKRLGSD